MKKTFLKSSFVAIFATFAAMGSALAGDNVTNQLVSHHNVAIYNDALEGSAAIRSDISAADNISDTSNGHHNAAIFEPSYMVLDLSDSTEYYQPQGDDVTNQQNSHHNTSIYLDGQAFTR